MVRIRLLGAFEVTDDRGGVIDLTARKARALLAVLARDPGRPHSREHLAALLWPDSGAAKARTSLRQTLQLLRRSLPDGTIDARPDVLTLAPGAAWVDAAAFEAAAAGDARAAVALYRGDFLEDLTLSAAPFEDWRDETRRALQATVLGAIEAELDRLERVGSATDCVALARRLLAFDPLHEPAHRALMRAFATLGHRSRAVEQYRACRSALMRELAVAPAPETDALLSEILGHPTAEIRNTAPAAERAPPAERPVVAVLPFAQEGGGAARAHVVAGLCEELTNCLAGWRLFPVTASTSTLLAGRTSDDPVAIGRRLGARYVVTGSQRLGEARIVISCRLIDSEENVCLWAERFDLEWAELFDAQEDAARRIAAMVQPEIERSEAARIDRKRPADITAWDYYAQGQFFLHRCTGDGNALARACYRRALEIEPDFSDALTGLATSHNWDVMFASTPDRAASLRNALDSARSAVQLDWTSSMAHLRLGGALTWLEALDAAMAETELAVALNPSNAQARMAFGNRLDLSGRPADGIAEMCEGMRLNPLDPWSFNYMGFLARAHLSLGDHAGALDWANRAVRTRPDHPDVNYRQAICLAHLDRSEEARDALEICERLKPGFRAARAGWRPYPDDARNALIFAGLDRHGLHT